MKTYMVNTPLDNIKLSAEGFDEDEGLLLFQNEDGENVAIFKVWNYVVELKE
jgi:hypothetical protein